MSKTNKDINKKENEQISLPGKNSSDETRKAENNKNSENKPNKAQKSGLYAALGVCMMSIAAAAIITYMGYSEFSGGEDIYTAGTGMQESTISEINEDDPMDKINKEESELTKDTAAEKTSENLHEKHDGDFSETNESEILPEVNKPEDKTETESEKKEENKVEVKETAGDAYEVSPQFARVVEGNDINKAYSADLLYNEVMKDYRTHNGIDIIASKGENVYASANGKVKGVYKDLLLGNVIEIEHGEYVFYYCGLDEVKNIKPGDIVTAGNILGTVGEIPFENNTSGHFHLEVKKDGLYIDPTEFIK